MKKLLAVALMLLSLGFVTLGCGGSKTSSEKKGEVVGPQDAPIPNPSAKAPVKK
jgi:hypothetical protein